MKRIRGELEAELRRRVKEDKEFEAKLSKEPRKVHASGHIENNVNFDERLSEGDHKVNEWESFSDYSNSDDDVKKDLVDQGSLKVLSEEQIRSKMYKKVFGTENESDQSFQNCKQDERRVLNVGASDFPLVKKVGRRILNFRLKKCREDHEGAVKLGSGGWKLSNSWDVTWHDEPISAEFLSKMLPYQKVNRFPGMQVLTRKTHLARGLARMAELFGDAEYDFFPRTWAMPIDLLDFRSHWFHNNKDSAGRRTN